MKIVHLSNNDIGGAGIATKRLHLAMLERGISSSLLTKQKHNERILRHFQFQPTRQFIHKVGVKAGLVSDAYAERNKRMLSNRPKGYEHFSLPFSNLDISTHRLVKEADIIHLHWVSDGFMDYPSFFKSVSKPVVWTLHDMNPFTGGCHHADDSIGYTTNCYSCPQLKNTIDEDYAGKMLDLKLDAISGIRHNMRIISPSQWLMDCSMKSRLFNGIPHFRIPNIADTKSFFLKDRSQCRAKLGLDPDKKILLLVAKDVDNPRKGFQYLLEVIKMLSDEYHVCTVGKSGNLFPGSTGFEYVEDSGRMNDIYNAADVFVLPSLAENFPNTICEALVCGTPVAAFDIGGVGELVNDSNGRLAEYKNADSLRESIEFICKNEALFPKQKISSEAMAMLDTEAIVARHMTVYNSFK